MNMRKSMVHGTAFLIAAGLIPLIAQATDTVTTGTITAVSPTTYAGTGTAVPFFIYLSTNDANLGCNSGNLSSFAIDSTTAAGRALIAVALSARVTGQQVTVYGTGACTVWGLTDTVHSIVF